MKKIFLFLLLVLVAGSVSAQVADSTATDTVVMDTAAAPGSAAGTEPAREKPGDGSTEETNVEEGDEGNEALRRLRAMREEKEMLTEKLEDAVAYPLNLETENLSSFQVLDSIAENNRFIFTGEDHRVEKLNTVLETKMMKYLNTKGYNYYLMEAGWASAWMVNRYILTGDSAAEQILSTYYSRNFFNMFKGLKEHNDTLPEERKIHAVGLDIERDAPLALRTLMLMLPDKQAPDSLEMFVESLKILASIHVQQAIDFRENDSDDGDMFDFGGYEFEFNYDDDVEAPKYFYFNMVTTIQDLTRRFREKESEFKEYLGPGYTEFERVIKEMENWLIWIGYEQAELPQSWVYREQYMESNFRKFFKDKPEAKGFGQFGRCHITRVTKVGDCGFAFFSSLNKRIITKMPELENQVASIGIFYGGLVSSNRIQDNGNIETLIDQTEKGTATLYMDLQDYGDEMLQTKFSAVIIAKSTRDVEEIDFSEFEFEEGDWQPKRKKANYTVLDANLTLRSIDLTSFNLRTGFRPEKERLENVEFNIVKFDDRLVLRISGGYFPKMEQSNDTTTLTLSGGSFRYGIGYDLMKAKGIDFVPEIGLGYQGLRFRETRKLGPPTLMGTNHSTDMKNPAFIMDARLSVGLAIRPFYFGGFAGYTFDLSKKSWIQAEEPIKDSPKTSFRGVYMGFSFGFMFYD